MMTGRMSQSSFARSASRSSRAADLRDRFRYCRGGRSEVSLTREQTIMQGASSCTFRLQVRTAIMNTR